ncbi:hypothetical protein O7635_02330 [Asanoa sp. WMMD1127]|uniref:hypothetical protein n=1 Tax=Asanoa sp. WMMD1127 TaxID=3016107 RepID=UPI002415ED3A|nr:hypothetical protein [Asanoa sp. WMMD1127]MDG4820688.1 hypothetical protein [Asanoa sp. WMMD1127]
MLRTALSLALLGVSPVTLAPGVAAKPDASQVDVAVTSDGSRDARYQVVVRNRTLAPTELTVRQSVPEGARVTATSPAPGPGGSPGPGSPHELAWPVRLGPLESTTLTATFTPERPLPLSTAACAYVGLAGSPVDCSATTWTPAGPTEVDTGPAPWWRHWWLPFAAGLVVVAAVLLARYAGPRAARRFAALTDRGRAGVAVLTALVLLTGLGVVAVALALPRLASATGTAARTPADGWLGPTTTGPLGTPLRDDAFEFTAYRFACEPAGGGQRCTAVVGLTNHRPAPEHWHPHLQRLAVAGSPPLSTDVIATRVANGGRDVFAAPVVPGHRLLAQLVWSVPAGAAPDQLELHSGAFAAGTRVNL